jgi:hypothetical protein
MCLRSTCGSADTPSVSITTRRRECLCVVDTPREQGSTGGSSAADAAEAAPAPAAAAPSAAAPRPAAAPAGPAQAPGAAALAPAPAEVTAWVLAPPPRLTYPAVVQLLDAARLQGFAALHGGMPGGAQSSAPLFSLADVVMLGLPGNGVCELGELPGDRNPGAPRQHGAFALLSRACAARTSQLPLHGAGGRAHVMPAPPHFLQLSLSGLPSLDLTARGIDRARHAQHMCAP